MRPAARRVARLLDAGAATERDLVAVRDVPVQAAQPGHRPLAVDAAPPAPVALSVQPPGGGVPRPGGGWPPDPQRARQQAHRGAPGGSGPPRPSAGPLRAGSGTGGPPGSARGAYGSGSFSGG